VDIDFNMCLDIKKIKLTKKTKAVIYVALNGRSGDMAKVVAFCKKHKLVLIEDACQALGSKNNGKYLGTYGRFGCFSLGFHKIITTGQGGFIVSNTKKDYETIEKLKDFGRLKGGNDIHDYLGFNFKFTDLQAVIGIEQLKTIDWRILKKKTLYTWYWGKEPDMDYVPWFIDFMSSRRDKLFKQFKKKEIQTRKMYPAIHTQKIYKQTGRFPNAVSFAEQILWLPSSLKLTKTQVNQIKEVLYEKI
jgi:perosamine synthetase